MNYLKDEKVISVREWIYAILSKWRSILAVSLITFIVVLSANIVEAASYWSKLSKSIIVTAVVKQVILFTILSAFVMVFVYAIKFVFSDIVKTETELKMTMNVDVLGNISEGNYNRNLWLDRKLKSYIGVKLSNDVDEATERVANVIKTKKSLDNNEDVRVAVVSSVSDKYAEKCVEKLSTMVKSELKLVMAGDIMTSPNAINIVKEIDCIILAEGINKSKYTVINDVCKQLSKWDKAILGIVIVE